MKLENRGNYISGDYHFHIFKTGNRILNIYGKIKKFNEKTGQLIVENKSEIKDYPGGVDKNLIKKDIIAISKNKIIQEIVQN